MCSRDEQKNIRFEGGLFCNSMGSFHLLTLLYVGKYGDNF